jgi:hypothetical protein
MITHARDSIHLPNPRYANTVVTAPLPAPTTVCEALRDPDWRQTMEDEFHALQETRTWTLIPRPRGINIISNKGLFKTKLLLDGTLERRKAQWVVCGFKQ